MNSFLRKLSKTRALSITLISMLLVFALATGVALASPSQMEANALLGATLPMDTCSYDGLSNTRTCELWAVAGTVDLPGSPGMPIWGFTDTDPALGGQAMLPGPTIIANQGETVEVVLHNELGETMSINFQGQAIMPDLNGVPAGGSTTYTFSAGSSGTYLYEAGPLPGSQHQVAMGLYGGLIVRPVGNQAYGPDSIFNDEALLLLSEIDPMLNNSANPAGFDMRGYTPKFFLINGKAYPETEEILSTAGNEVLLRIVNAGIEQHSLGTLGVEQTVLAIDGSPLSYPYQIVSGTIGAGQTSDRMVMMPDPVPAGGAKYAVYDTSLLLNNNGAAGYGGMLTFITLTDGNAPATGPTTSTVLLSPNSTDGEVDVTLSATVSGDLPITGAEFFIDAQGAAGTGTAMSASDGAFDEPSEGVEAVITVADLSALLTGDHSFYVHGTDGTWGSFNFAVLHLDKLGPATSAITLAPNPSDASAAVSIGATGNDNATGGSNISAAEFFIDATGADGTGVAMTVNIAEPIASLAGSIDTATLGGLAEGDHTVFVHSMDSFGWWGDFGAVTLVVDQTGPVTSNVVAVPNPNNGALPYNPTVYAVRVDALLVDTSSNIKRAEGFIDAAGADGSGFPLTPRDGQFNELQEDAYVYIPLSTINQLSVGVHPIFIHAQDASGNWGAVDFVDLVIERDAPTVSNAAVDPVSTDGSVLVALSAEATDPSSDIVMAEWFTGADPGAGNGNAMSVSWNAATLVWDLAASVDASGWAPGDYTLFMRARDAAGNWSQTTSVVLTVTEGPPPVPMMLYFSTAGNGAVSGVGAPNDDADVYLWDGTLFSRVFDGTAEGGLPGNTNIDALAFDGALFYLSFNRNGGTNVPGLGTVQDEDVVTYNPVDLQWELFSAGVDICEGLDASNGHDIDAFDLVGGVIYFSTEGDASITSLAGPFDNADIYIVDAGGCGRVFDASVEGLPGNANIDGLTVVDNDTFYMSFDADGISVPGLGIVQDEDVVLFDAGVWTLYFDGTAQGLGGSNSQNLDAIDVQ